MDGKNLNRINLSISLVRKLTTDGYRWLAIWNESKNYYDFVIGQRLERESFRETVLRETAWELGLDRTKDFLVSNMAQANLQFEGFLPGVKEKSEVNAAFYNVEIFRDNALLLINEDPRTIWLTSQEVCSGQTNDFHRLNPMLTFLIHKSQAVQHWESSSEKNQ